MRLLSFIIICLLQANYSSASHQWTQRADYGSFGRHRGTGTGIGNKAYVGTGHLNGTGFDMWYADWWEYDPATNAWVQKADYPGNFGNGDQDIVSITLGNYVFAGLGQLDGNSFFKYAPQTNLWTPATSPPATNNFNNTFPFGVGTDGFFPALFSNQLYKYDSLLDTWTLINVLPFSTTWGVQCITLNGKGYIKNGYFLYEYDPVLNTFTAKTSYPGTTPERPRVFAQDGNLFYVGGMDASWTWSSEVWRYSPADDNWFQMEDFPGTTRRWAVAVNIGNRAYYGLGTNGTNFHDWWEFSTQADLEEFKLDEFDVFPNPVLNHVTFTSNENQTFEIEIYNYVGELISRLSAKNGQCYYKRQHEPAGSYIYKVTMNGGAVHTDQIIFI